MWSYPEATGAERAVTAASGWGWLLQVSASCRPCLPWW
jgi:hypothetical protein